MLERFLKYIREEGLCRGDERVLLAVSGGMDSMLMAALFSQGPFSFALAHCNFGLRGAESDEDEQFVKQQAEKLGAPFYSTRFQTLAYARREKISTQMAARQLRYEWFNKTADKEGYQAIAVAHHLNDLVETMLINLVRGTGPAGMHGIPSKNGNIIRPLLAFTREEIAAAVKEQAVSYREESSNTSDKYLRNRLRHHVVPVLKASNPSVEHTFAATARHFSEAEQFIEHHMAPYRDLLIKDGENWQLSCQAIGELKLPGFILFHLLRPFGFNAANARDILGVCDSQPGKQFFSSTHRLIKDRDRLIVTPLRGTAARLGEAADSLQEAMHSMWKTAGSGQEAAPPGQGATGLQKDAREKSAPREDAPGQSPALFEHLFETAVLDAEKAEIIADTGTAFLDYGKLQLPLTVRYWQEGDRFHPLGMQGHKKLSDFFVDLKIPLHIKDRIPLVLSGGEIAWVAGYRIAEPFKVRAATEKVYRIKYKIPKIN